MIQENKSNKSGIISKSATAAVILYAVFIETAVHPNEMNRALWILLYIAAAAVYALTLPDLQDKVLQRLSNIKWLKKYAERISTSDSKDIIRIGSFIVMQTGMIEILSPYTENVLFVVTLVVNLFILAAITAFFYLVLGTPRRAMLMVNIAGSILGFVNHYYAKFRGSTFAIIDALMAETAAGVMGNYKLTPDIEVLLWLVLEIIFVYLWRHSKGQKDRKRHIASAVAYVLTGAIFITAYNPSVSYWSEGNTTRTLGYTASLIAYAKHDLSIEEPDNYSEERVEEILGKYDSDDSKEWQNTPDVIVIMNEAFSDLPSVYGFETNQDVMPYIHSLSDNTVKGNLLVSVYGGSTADTEWEFLTGNSLGFLGTDSVPYMQYINGDEESLASELKEEGYTADAFHPGIRTNYSRDTVYPALGFENFTSIEDDLEYTEGYGTLWGKPIQSDNSDIKNLINIYEENKGKPQFIFNVTMQNHGDYSTRGSRVPITTYAKDENMRTAQLDEYLSLVRLSDDAFKELTEYLETVDRDVIVLMFGDHQPGFYSKTKELLKNSYEQSDKAVPEEIHQYVSPFVMWANFDIEEDEDITISPGYLRALLLEKAGMSLGSYEKFLLDCRDEYPAINSFGYYDKDMTWHKREEGYSGTILEDYWALQYRKMFGDADLSAYN